jgi:adenylate cyclase
MPTSPDRCAILFADVCGSSHLYRELGNHAAEFKIRQLLQRATVAIHQQKGRLVKTIGDEVMACFQRSDQALATAIAIQRLSQDGALQLRIGVSFGDVLVTVDDVFGETVNDAAFVAQIARAEEIILTTAMYADLSPEQQQRCREFDRVALKGGAARTLIYRVQWQAERELNNATQVMSLMHTTQQVHRQRLQIHTPSGSVDVLPTQTPYRLGRASSNALQTDTPFASREHCHLLYRRGKFVLVDHSTNGTYVTPEGQREIYLRREELPLDGCGLVSLGCPAQQSPYTLTYSSVQAQS